MKHRLVRVIAITLLLATACAYAGDDEDDKPEPAPRFHAKTMSGESFTNDSVKGKVVLLEFWTTWCPYCRQEQYFIDQIDREFSSKGLIVLAIDVAESKKKVLEYLQQHPRSCRIVLMQDTNLAAMYEATRYPIYVLIGRDGNIVTTQRGAVGDRGLRQMLRQADLGLDE